MSRATRRRAKREAEKEPQLKQSVQLVNPVAGQFGAFIVGNATKCEKVIVQDEALEQHIVICGAGPSLNEPEARALLDSGDYDQLWGCNSALIWLLDNGHEPTHGFTIDQTPHMLEEWYDRPDVKYLVASSVHPHLTEWLLDGGRDLTFFHNFVGLEPQRPVRYGVCKECSLVHHPGTEEEPCTECGGVLDVQVMSYEDWVYVALFPGTVRVGAGLNSVSRAIDLAVWMGGNPITVLGADCALKIKRPPPQAPRYSHAHRTWLHETVMHADGSGPLRSGATGTTMGAEIDGRWWETKPDMAITAVHLVKMKRHFGDRLRLVGDTLPNALEGKPEEYLNRLPNIHGSDGKVVGYQPPPGITPVGVE